MVQSVKLFRSKTLLLSALLLLTAAAPPQPEMVFKSRDHQKLGKLIGDYYEAKSEQSGINDARAKLEKAIAKLMKKKDVPFLSMVEDLEEALYFSREYKGSVPKGRVTDESLENVFDMPEVEYAVHAPKNYKASNGPFPLLLCFTDAGESPADHIKKKWLEGDLLGGVILAACKLPDDKSVWGAIQGGLGNAMQVLSSMKRQYAIDGDQVFVVGNGASVPTAVKLAATFPDLFSGVVGRAGDMDEIAPTNFRNVSTFFAGGGANCTAFEKAAKEAEIANCTIKADATEADIWEWIQATRRNPHPLDVTLAPIDDVGRGAYWVTIDRFDPAEEPTIRATIDRETNTITLVGSGIGGVNLYFNDTLINLDEKIVVIANGVRHELVMTRRLDFALDWCYEIGDRTRAYVNSYSFDLPEVTSEEG